MMTIDGGVATFLDLTQHEKSTLLVTGVHGHYPARTHVPAHQHDCYHLLYAAEGLMRVETDGGEWLLPPLPPCGYARKQSMLFLPIAKFAHMGCLSKQKSLTT